MSRVRTVSRTARVVPLAVLLSITVLAFMPRDARDVAAPGIACTVMMLWLWTTLWDRDRAIPFFDVGVLCALATLLYTVYPLVNFWADGFQFGILSDARLRSYNPEASEVGFFHLRHVLYLFCFVVSYAVFRGRTRMETGNVGLPPRSTRQLFVWFFLALTGYFVLLRMTTGVNYNGSYEPDTYAQNMAAFSNLPLSVRQVSGKLLAILFVFKLGCLALVVRRSKDPRWFMLLLVWMAVEFAQTFALKGSRTGLVLLLMGAALFYHRMIKPLSMKFLATSGAGLLGLFIFLGLYRAYVNLASMQTDLAQANMGFLSGSNEFQALFGTAYDVLQRKEAGAYLPRYLYINDFISLLPPQQIMPFEKVAASEWYLREIGMSGTGVGFMWGVIAQSITGMDWIELALRGALLGYILARIHRWYLKHQSAFLPTLLYTYLCLRIYYTFRDTTFTIVGDLLWVILPFYIFLKLGNAFASRPRTPSSRRVMVLAGGDSS